MILRLKHLLPLFFLLSFLILYTEWWIIHSQHFVTNSKIFASAITFDICLLIPMLYYFTIRKSRIPKISVLPIFIISMQVAALILPAQNHQWINFLEWLLLPIEIFIVGWIIYKAQNGIRAFRQESGEETDLILKLRSVAAKESGSKLFGNIFGSELAIFYFLFFAKNDRLPSSKSIQAFSYHKRIAYPMTIVIFILIILIETFALHLLLLRWHPIPAWIASLSSIYLILFLIADVRAVVHRPIYLDDQYLYIRMGLRWYFRAPLVDIHLVKPSKKTTDYKNCQKMVLFGDPNLLIRFNREQEAIGIYGMKKKFQELGIQIDQPEQFAKYINEKASSGS